MVIKKKVLESFKPMQISTFQSWEGKFASFHLKFKAKLSCLSSVAKTTTQPTAANYQLQNKTLSTK